MGARIAALCGLGVLAALWVVLGRGLFGPLGSLTVIYALILGLPILVLHALIARALARTARAGFVTRRATWLTVATAWLCFTVLGLTIPDRIDGVLHTLVTGSQQPGLGLAIGIANPMGIIGIGLCVASLILAVSDSRGPRKSEDEILDEAAAWSDTSRPRGHE